MLAAQALSGTAVLAIYVLVPLGIIAVIFAVVLAVSRPDSHTGSQILGHPAELSRRERDAHPPAPPGPAPADSASAASTAPPNDGQTATAG